MTVQSVRLVRYDGSLAIMSGTVKGFPVTFAADGRMAQAIPPGASAQVESWQIMGMPPFVARALARELPGKAVSR